jgi:cysteine-rich repeat protein
MRHVVVMLSILACAGLADFAAAATPAQTCTAAKLKAAGKTAFSVLKCDFKAVRKDEPVDSSCLAKAGERLQRAFGKAEGKGGCTTSGDVGAHQTTVDALESDVLAAITFDPDADSRKCASGKIKEVGKLASKNLACRSKAAKRGEPVDQACLDKASGRLANKFAKLESKGSCTTNGDAAAMATRVEDFAQSIVGLLADTCDATCGDGVVGPGEDCDGVDDAACPGDCDLACSCPTNCGDGVVDGSEECDDGGTVGGDGCSASCTLEDPSARCAGVQSFPGAALDTELVADGLSSPVFVTAPPLDTRRLFIVEQTGTIQVLEDGVRSTFLDISADVTVGGERGLLSMAFHPDYENNGRFFVNYTGTACNGAGGY